MPEDRNGGHAVDAEPCWTLSLGEVIVAISTRLFAESVRWVDTVGASSLIVTLDIVRLPRLSKSNPR
jgi:hypothetical protein